MHLACKFFINTVTANERWFFVNLQLSFFMIGEVLSLTNLVKARYYLMVWKYGIITENTMLAVN